MALDVKPLAIPDVKLITPQRFGDERGYFAETYNARAFEAAGVSCTFVQDNESLSAPAGTLRGLHYQAPPFAQAKLIRVLRGAVLDVCVDARRGSPTFARWVKARLDAADGAQLFVPRGFLHGFVTLTPDTMIAYKVDNFYDKDSDGGVAWNDPELAIDWELDGREPVLSAKDAAAPGWAAFDSPF
ncbi:MAG: dTDP-4-dehydrorhamnose 3,5-epimerase [Caulobacterales bacterium]|nr:dTDP-4-dehydrorhamnose 3,5-epimerase [Caulobacterales bacterium]